MKRVTVTFLVLLGLATLTLGQLWKRGQALWMGQGTILDTVLTVVSAALLILALLGASRMLNRMAQMPRSNNSDHHVEDRHA